MKCVHSPWLPAGNVMGEVSPPLLRIVPTVPAVVLCCVDLATVFMDVTDSDV